jgi:signal transduction histidine kinase
MCLIKKFFVLYSRDLYVLLLAGAALGAASFANAGSAFPVAATQVDLTPFVEYIEDAEGKLTFADVSNAEASRFKPVNGTEAINLGYSKSTFWLRFPLATSQGAADQRLLEVRFFELGHVAFYAPGQAPVVTGQNYPLSSRVWPHRFYVFPVTLAEEPRYYYLQVRSDSAVTVSLTLWEPAAFAADTQQSYMLQALYYGALLALLLYNLFIYFSLRERDFLLYCLFAACMGLTMLTGNGIAQQFLWPTEFVWNAHIVPLTNALTAASALYFAQHFLQTRTVLPVLHRVMHLTAGFALLAAVAPWLHISAGAAGVGLSLCLIIAGILVITAGILALCAGNRSARVFLLAWAALSLGAVVMGMRQFGLLPTTTLTVYAVQISSFAEMLLLSFALAQRIRIERDAREAAQADTLTARQSLVESLRQSASQLEKTVAERTAELQKSLKNEQKVLERYIRFGSLISHEFRNPLAIIQSQLVLIEKEKQHGVDHAERRLSAISGATKRLGILFEEWLQSDRLRQQTQEIDPTPISLKSWLDGILLDCRICYAHHPFELRVEPELPVLLADEPMLRIALLNLVDNAAKYSPAGTEIIIEAATKDNMVGLTVIDQGAGIPDEHRDDVFTAYFRSDPDGSTQGLGLGLAFVQKIVDMHHGKIELQSETGKGCRFCLWLPCNEKAPL